MGLISVPLAVNEIVEGNLYVKYYEPRDIAIVLYVSMYSRVRVLHSTGKIELWNFDAFRGIYRRLE